MSNIQDFIKKHGIPKLGFGCMRFPTLGSDDKVDVEETKKLVDKYIEAGFNYFDTAYIYHGGTSEVVLKQILVERYPRDSFILVDKLPMWRCDTPADVERIFNEQLERCGVEYFDIYLLHALNHDFNAKAEKFGAYDFCNKMKQEGKIKLFGFSFHGTTQDLHNIMAKHHEEFDIVQLQLNYFDWLGQYREQFEIIKSYNKPVVCMEPVRGGILARLPEKIGQILTQANPNVSHASWAVRWVGSVPEVVNVLSGMSNMEQVLDNIAHTKNFVPLSPEELAVTDKVAAALAQMPQVPCTACNYCVNCPESIPIVDVFKLYNKFLQDRDTYNFTLAYKEIEAGKTAAACTACGFCAEQCPQNIDIPDKMKEISSLMNM